MPSTVKKLEYLTQEQVEKFRRDGYLRLPSFLSPEDTEALLERSKQLLESFTIEDHPLTRFTTGDDNHVGDDYFLTSGDKIRYFLEEDAVGPDGKLNRPKDRAVNKIGHGLHEQDPVFRKVTLENEAMESVVRDLQFHHDPVALQSMVICKQPQIGGEVPEHNDSYVFSLMHIEPVWLSTIYAYLRTFLYTDPPTALGVWIALEKCTSENGALSFLPGSHLTAPITKRFVRLPQGGTGFEILIPPDRAPKVPEGKYLLEACMPGDMVLIHGSVLHKSEKNLSPNTRFAYAFHMIESPPYATYDDKNWLQPTAETPFPHILDEPNPRTVPVSA
ncbi:phytanoyl-CoA dioxygenase [Laetiporus sulphureus 93-53]|uniref:Phytanoyl-CoA dioxygenase n=1 Tax=Laetiporus sulphureus 93-53 TaxID=1314785 RepID=A0A165H081_9APHY|nr:phytanoyl-CoA dioxygenase [Laetiporus sulphureus 93-53]KZT11069.1 phytanoyl-CoA dioxygenase [Laetiporus sulphureus 93-53]